jgi:hypothetical protein
MRTKKIKTVITEKINYDDYSLTLEPALLLKLFQYAHTEATSNEHLYSIVAKAQMLAETTPFLGLEHYDHLVGTKPSTLEQFESQEEMTVEVSPEETPQ